MSRIVLALVLVALPLGVALGLGACGGDDEESSLPTTTISGGEETSTEGAAAPDETTIEDGLPAEEGSVVTIETDSGEEVAVRVEIADTEEERQVGLMNRESLPADAGMIFLFGEESTGGFWMKNTLIPLSIAFADEDGTILSILDMEPCEADPCEIYDPGVPYWAALEVNQGAFDEWGVTVGDLLIYRQQ